MKRNACRLVAIAAAFVALSPTLAAPPSPTIAASANLAVVRTVSGEVQGFVRDGILSFRGIPYATAERFMPPVAPARWATRRLALSFGNTCPQPIDPGLREPQTFIADTHYWPASEACQNLNIWTPGNGGKMRPVMVWLHGGGFFSGSSAELGVYDGTNLSRKGDIVVVSLNHRLNVLGFFDLSAHGDAYKQSANVGMLDIVKALEWVRDNIAAFGGDPSNITIFGQSGGGAKVSTLLASPAAQGLFHKAIVQSGAPGSMPTPYSDRATSRRVADLTLANAGLSAGDADKMRMIPYDALMAAANKALMTVSKDRPGPPGGFAPPVSWSPVVDGDFLPARPFGDAAPAVSKGVPLMLGSTISEFQNFPNPRLRGRETWGDAEVMAYLREVHGAKADAVMAAYRKAYPARPANQLPLIDSMFRSGVLRTARLKAAQGDAVYAYLFALPSPVLDHAWSGGHSSELPFVFDNAAAGVQGSGGGRIVDRLTDQMSQAWINFARTGDPGHKGLPRWPRSTPERDATMIFDAAPAIRLDHDRDLIALLSAR